MIHSLSIFTVLLMATPKTTPAAAPKTEVKFCAHAPEKHGVRHCAYPLKPEVAQKRNRTYRFTYLDGRVQKMELVNGLGLPFLNQEGRAEFSDCATIEYAWNPDGKGWTTTYRGIDGEAGAQWKNAGKVRDLLPDPEEGKTPGGSSPTDGDDVTREKWTEDSKGYIKTIRYFDSKDRPVKDVYGAFGYQYERNDAGLVLVEQALNAQGKPMALEDGIVKYIFSYDAQGNLLTSEARDAAGKPKTPKYVYPSKRTWDEVGNLVGEVFLDLEGKPATGREGVGGWKMKYDAHGNLTQKSFFDIEGKPGLSVDKIGGQRFVTDAKGLRVEIWNLGLDGKPMKNEEGWVARKFFRDVPNRTEEIRFLDVQGKPVARTDGIGRIKKKDSADGSVTEEWFYDVDGKPKLNPEGVHGVVETFDDAAGTLTTCNFGLDGKKKANLDGVTCDRSVFDKTNDNFIERWYTDAAGALVLSKNEGIAGWKATYDKAGNELERWYYGTHKELVMHKELEYAGLIMTYDAKGELVGEKQYDQNRKPIPDPSAIDLNDPGDTEGDGSTGDDDPSTP